MSFDGGQGHLRLEGRSVIPSRSLHRLAPLVHHHLVAFVKPGSHLSHCPNFWSSLYASQDLALTDVTPAFTDGELTTLFLKLKADLQSFK